VRKKKLRIFLAETAESDMSDENRALTIGNVKFLSSAVFFGFLLAGN
jgi:hypothetical protein